MPELDGAGHGRKCILTLSTSKLSRTMAATATVTWLDPDFGYESHLLFGDFSWTAAKRGGVATQRAIDTLHAEAFTPEAIERIKAEVRAFYAKNPEAGIRDALRRGPSVDEHPGMLVDAPAATNSYSGD
jgi:hypothetical protein